MEDYYEYLDSNGITTLYKLIKDDTVALIDSYSVTINGITTTLDTHINSADIHTPIATIEGMIDTAIGSLDYATPDYVDTKISGLVNSAPETLDTLKELSDALGNDPNFATTVANQIGNKADKDSVYIKQETNTLLDGKANSVHNHVVSDITDFPTIPTKLSELTNDSGYITNVTWEDVIDKPELSQVAISGSYNDLNNTPTIPTKVSQLENDTGFINALTDVVDTKSNQTIGGTKTFTSSPWVTNNGTTIGFSIKNTAIGRGEVPSEIYHNTFRVYDKNTKIMGEFCVEKSNSGSNLARINVRSEDANGKEISRSVYLKMSNDGTKTVFYPNVNNNIDLGMLDYKWAKIYSDDVVHTSGDEYISGTKHFYNAIYSYQGVHVLNGAMDINTTPTSTICSNIIFNDKNYQTTSYIQYGQQNSGTDFIGLFIHDKNRALHGIQILTNNYVKPLTNNAYSLGSPNNKWANVYATTFNGNLKGSIDSSTTATTQATSDNSTKIATTAWVRNYVNSVGGSGAVGASISAYYSNATTLTAESSSTIGTNLFPAVYSGYINIAPTVGTIYTGSQLFGTLNASASGSKSSHVYQTTAKATAKFSGAFSSSAKYLCTTANAVKFRAYVTQGTSSNIGTASVVNNTSAKSIFIRVQ